ncbi:MAG TPA: hypothetical protein VGF95_07980 [Solirubrobacteraceae bacterium]
MDIAELALLRLLWLQRETHRAARWRQSEAVALLARASAEACLIGLYWLHGEDEAVRMRGHNAKSFRCLFTPITSEDLITPGLIDSVAATVGSPAELPTLREMAEVIAEKSGQRFATDIYGRVFVPLSTLSAHTTGWALLRHVDSKEKLENTPTPTWTRCSALAAVDACTGGLAVAIAVRTVTPEARFVDYAEAHMSRTIAPVAVMGGIAAIRSLRWSKVPHTLRSFAALRRYYDSGEAARDPLPERKARTEQALDELLQVLGDNTGPQRQLVLEHFTELTAQLAAEETVHEPE